MTAENEQARDQAEIRRLITDQQNAICAKDVDRIMSHYADEVILFNVKPPFRISGTREWHRVWETSLAHFPASFGMETRELMITVSRDLAVAHWLFRFTGIGQDENWIRDTVVYQRNQDKWLIVHEHCSVPLAYGHIE